MDLKEARFSSPHRHPWELSRARCISSLVRDLPEHARVVDIGAGDLFFAKDFIAGKNFPIDAVDEEYEHDGVLNGIRCHRHLSSLSPSSYDAAFLLDVLEHVDDEEGLLKNIFSVLKPGGILVVTVPAHQALFSKHDVFLEHRRRYNRGRLCAAVSGVDGDMAELFSFYTLPLIVRIAEVLSFKFFPGKPYVNKVSCWKFPLEHFITQFVEKFLNADFIFNRWIQRFVPWPFGLSLCMVLRKKGGR